jgi:hypothetical protein
MALAHTEHMRGDELKKFDNGLRHFLAALAAF